MINGKYLIFKEFHFLLSSYQIQQHEFLDLKSKLVAEMNSIHSIFYLLSWKINCKKIVRLPFNGFTGTRLAAFIICKLCKSNLEVL